MEEPMSRHLFAAAVLAALIAAPAASVAQAPQPAAAQPAKPDVKKKPVPKGLAAARERQKKCGVEWKDAKAAGGVAKDMTWPKFWSACNKRMKAQAT
jgi:hypothetical protein